MHLNTHTHFSFRYGTLSPNNLFDAAKACGVHKLVITEINTTASYIEVLRICNERKDEHVLEIAVGVEFRQDGLLQFISIAKDIRGFEEINRYLSYRNKENFSIPSRAPAFEHVFVVYPFGKIFPNELKPYEFIGLRLHELNLLPVQRTYKENPEQFIALQPVTFADKVGFNVHRLLRAIDLNLLLSKLPVHQQARENEILVSDQALENSFCQYPVLIQQTKKIFAAVSFDMKLGIDKNKKDVTGNLQSDWDQLVGRAWEGFQKRYDAGNEIMRERFDRELGIIRQKNFCSYYLIAYDLVRFADEHGYDHVGRGSGANSMVAYCLGITDVDPIELDLYFERFLNTERTSPPDFDIDFSWKDRNHIYDYVFSKYGTDHACLLGTHVTFQRRSVLRELGKVFGLPKDEIDDMVDNPIANQNRDHIRDLIFRYADRLHEIPSMISIHAGGVLITDKPIYQYTALEYPPKDYPVAHFDMHQAEDLGIYKLDILSQRGLGHIKESVRLIKENKGVDVDIHRFHYFKKDDKVRELLKSARAMGCFYVESPAMRQLLGKLRCEDYLTLVAASSIIRPGVAQSGMMRTYIERFHAVRNGGTYSSIHPKMDELMKETYGVMVYQEDVIKVAHHFAGLTLTEADVLRRGMSGKFRSRKEFDRVRESFFRNCAERGYPQAITDRVWFEIESFSGYSFAKGHSASYAVESYQSLFLKAHYPLEFMVGVINNFGGFYSTEFYFHEARMSGAQIEAPCVNNSEHTTSIRGTCIYMGFIHLKSLESGLAERIPEERKKNGVFRSLSHFLKRVQIGLEQVRLLIRIGAFRFSGKTKQQLLWEAMLYFSEVKTRVLTSYEIFDDLEASNPLPVLQHNAIEDAFDEMELLGFPLCDPFELVSSSERGNVLSEDLKSNTGKMVSIMGYMVAYKPTRTKKKENMFFGTFYDCHGIVFDTVHFPDSAAKFPLRGRGFYFIKGYVMDDFGVPIIEARWMEKVPMKKKVSTELLLNQFSVS